MSDTIFTNKIKPSSGKTINVSGELVVDDIQVTNPSSDNSFIPLPSGCILPFAGRNVPTGFLLCDGREILRTEYTNLFDAIGEEWGDGNGSTTFNIPDLRGAFLRGAGLHGTMKKSNGNAFSGPRVGDYDNDQFQQFGINQMWSGSGNDWYSGLYFQGHSYVAPGISTNGEFTGIYTDMIVNDGTNGTPRKGDETKPFNAGVNYIIKI